jgi:integrase
MTISAPADEPARQKPRKSKSTPKLRDGVMKRGNTWSYVIRVKDPETSTSKPKWVGGFATEAEAKAARDEGRVKARRGEYIDHNRITVTAYLDEWIDAHAMAIKPRTLLDYRACIRLYVTPRIGHPPIQAVRPSTITKLYRDLLTSGGRDGQPLAVATVTHLHTVLRKAFRDAVIVEELIGSNPVERAKRPTGRSPRARNRLDHRAAPSVPGYRGAAPAVRFLSCRGVHRSAPR